MSYLKIKKVRALLMHVFWFWRLQWFCAYCKVMPVFIAKQQLDTFATELCRTAEIAGAVGSATTAKGNNFVIKQD